MLPFCAQVMITMQASFASTERCRGASSILPSVMAFSILRSNLCPGVLAQVMITTYDSFKKNLSAMLEIPWHVAILDEAHTVKNPKSQITDAVMQLKTCFKRALFLLWVPHVSNHVAINLAE